MSDYTYDYGNAPEAAPVNGKGTGPRDVVEFPQNIPVSLSLKYAKPRRIETKRGTRWMATTSHGPVAFFDTETALQIERLEPKPGEVFWVCFKKTSKSDLGHYDVWLDPSTERARGLRPEPPSQLEQQLKASIDEAAAKKASAQKHQTPADNSQAFNSSNPTPDPPRTQLERALEVAVQACYHAQEYARTIGYTAMPLFSGEDIRALANCLLINKERHG